MARRRKLVAKIRDQKAEWSGDNKRDKGFEKAEREMLKRSWIIPLKNRGVEAVMENGIMRYWNHGFDYYENSLLSSNFYRFFSH